MGPRLAPRAGGADVGNARPLGAPGRAARDEQAGVAQQVGAMRFRRPQNQAVDISARGYRTCAASRAA